MRIGSLFSGIGGLDLAVEVVTGGDVTWQCEKDDYCRKVLAQHWGVPIYPDITRINHGNIERVEALCGGFPCQDISQAGNRAGIEGERSGLWAEYARLIRLLRPELVFVENVRALTLRGLDTVLGDLAACGYDAAWDMLGACCVGAPHRRERLFILAHPQGGVSDACRSQLREQWQRNGWQQAQQRPAVSGDDGQIGAVADPDDSGRPQLRGAQPAPPEHTTAERGRPQVPNTNGRRRRKRRESEHGGQQGSRGGELVRRGPVWEQFDPEGRWQTEPGVRRVVDGFPGRVDRLKALGNAVVPQQGAYAFKVLAERLRVV